MLVTKVVKYTMYASLYYTYVIYFIVIYSLNDFILKFPIKLFSHAARVRPYTRWTQEDTSVTMAYFSKSIADVDNLPGQYISKWCKLK